MKLHKERTGSVRMDLMNTLAGLRRQVTQLEKELNLLRQFAFHDALTGLPNRRLLQDRINQAIVRATRNSNQIALLFIDLDGFKQLNDSFGHCTGDKLLQSVAKRLLSCVREADSVCRYGGDEFVILLHDINGEQKAKEVAEKVHACFSEIFLVDKLALTVTASIGIALYLENKGGYHDLIRQADLAMYVAKARTRAKPRRATAQ